MKETIKILFMLTFINFFILGCIDVNDAITNQSIKGECNLNIYSIETPLALNYPSNNVDDPTIILLHGENDSPESSHMKNLAEDFNYDGYNVVMPYMAWYNNQWNSTFCDNISFLNYLIVTQRTKTSQNIILAGHGLGATTALAYTTMSNTLKPDILNILAPSHFIHQSSELKSSNAPSIALAKEMLENNQSQIDTPFTTYNNGSVDPITTTPEIYLSFHDEDKFPNIKNTTPLIRFPMLWLAGDSDPQTEIALNFGIRDLIPLSETYEELSGDHYTFLPSASDEFNIWYDNLLATP